MKLDFEQIKRQSGEAVGGAARFASEQGHAVASNVGRNVHRVVTDVKDEYEHQRKLRSLREIGERAKLEERRKRELRAAVGLGRERVYQSAHRRGATVIYVRGGRRVSPVRPRRAAGRPLSTSKLVMRGVGFKPSVARKRSFAVGRVNLAL
jgi:hypothetical protein